MSTKERGDDAAEHAPRPGGDKDEAPRSGKQDAPNYDKRTDEGQAVRVEDMNSANDEGAA